MRAVLGERGKVGNQGNGERNYESMFDVALLTDSRYCAAEAPEGDWYLGNILSDDHLLRRALAELGWSSSRVAWSDAEVDWSAFRLAVFRTTWDYFDRFDEFSKWLERVSTRTQLCNELSLVRWNMDKHYLADLEARGVAAPPTRYIERGSTVGVAELLDETGWREAVIKPCVSGAARLTYRVDARNAAEVDRVIEPFRAKESFLLQPFQRTILEQGEDSLMVFGGRYSHAVRKLAKPGDFRVQDDHGGTVHARQPLDAQVELAERAMAACDPRPAYGRVDMIQDDAGRWIVMELELIEPELWLRFAPASATAFARAIAQRL